MISSFDDQPSGISQVIGAAAGLAGAAMYIPGVSSFALKAAGKGLKYGAITAGIAAIPFAGAGLVGTAAVGAGMYAGVRSGYFATIAKRAVFGARDLVGGGLTAASWIYKHPGIATMGAAAGGLGLALVTDPIRSHAEESGEGMVTNMGGTSSYYSPKGSVSATMAAMQASGSIVLGMNNRR